MRYRLQNKKNPTKFKYITSNDYKLGDTATFKWQEEWIVIKIIERKPRDLRKTQ